MSFMDKLPRPFFVLAPMDDVTDVVFRQQIANLAPPDLFFTEFINVDALQSKGREATLPRLLLGPNEGTRDLHGDAELKSLPIIAQIWGKNPENFYKTAQQIANGSLADEANWHARKNDRSNKLTGSDSKQGVKTNFSGLDLNFGCPDKNVVRNGTCSALILPENRGRAVEIIQATREGGSSLPLSVKTRLGFSEIDYSWHEILLKQKLNALSIHGRTKAQMSKVPASWDAIGEVVKLRDKLFPATLMIGNGDVLSRKQGEHLASKYKLDGIMIGRGVFNDPFVFAKNSPWEGLTKQEKLKLYEDHVGLFASTWKNNERNMLTLNKFCKIYIQGFDGAKELREKLMNANTINDLLTILRN